MSDQRVIRTSPVIRHGRPARTPSLSVETTTRLVVYVDSTGPTGRSGKGGTLNSCQSGRPADHRMDGSAGGQPAARRALAIRVRHPQDAHRHPPGLAPRTRRLIARPQPAAQTRSGTCGACSLARASRPLAIKMIITPRRRRWPGMNRGRAAASFGITAAAAFTAAVMAPPCESSGHRERRIAVRAIEAGSRPAQVRRTAGPIAAGGYVVQGGGGVPVRVGGRVGAGFRDSGECVGGGDDRRGCRGSP